MFHAAAFLHIVPYKTRPAKLFDRPRLLPGVLFIQCSDLFANLNVAGISIYRLIIFTKLLCELGGTTCYDNDLVAACPDGSSCRSDRVSADFSQMLKRSGMAHIRFRDLRHTAAKNMHQLAGHFYTVGKILGHRRKGIGIQLGMGADHLTRIANRNRAGNFLISCPVFLSVCNGSATVGLVKSQRRFLGMGSDAMTFVAVDQTRERLAELTRLLEAFPGSVICASTPTR